MRDKKQALKAFLVVALGGPFLVGLVIIFLLLVTKPPQDLGSVVFFKGAGATLLFTYAFGIVPALVAALGVALMVYRRGRFHFLWLPLIAFGAGFFSACLVVLLRKGFAGLLSVLDIGIFLGLCGLFANLLLLPFLWRMKVVERGAKG